MKAARAETRNQQGTPTAKESVEMHKPAAYREETGNGKRDQEELSNRHKDD